MHAISDTGFPTTPVYLYLLNAVVSLSVITMHRNTNLIHQSGHNKSISQTNLAPVHLPK